MEFKEYTQEALRTLSPTFYGEKVRKEALEELIADLRVVESKISKLKRAIFYGKPQEGITAIEGCTTLIDAYPQTVTKKGFDTLHSLLGLTGESLEALLGFIDKKGEVNEVEELGDILWFLALYTSTREVDINRAMEANIAKLRARYPDKFDSDLSVNRNLQAEAEAIQAALTA